MTDHRNDERFKWGVGAVVIIFTIIMISGLIQELAG